MKRLIILLTLLLALAMLAASAYFPGNFAMTFAEDGFNHVVARAVVALLLLSLLLTTPPRSRLLRALLGASSLALGCLSMYEFMRYGLGVLDAALYIETAIICGLEALGRPAGRRIPVTRIPTPPRRITVLSA